jgi:hypothetical protein
MKQRIVFVVGHRKWGKSRTLQALIDLCGKGRRASFGETEFLVRIMSNDDRPKSYFEFMEATTKEFIVAALCPVFNELTNDNRADAIDGLLANMRAKGYRFFFWVIKHQQFSGEEEVSAKEISKLRRYGVVQLFERRNVDQKLRAKVLRRFISSVVLAD